MNRAEKETLRDIVKASQEIGKSFRCLFTVMLEIWLVNIAYVLFWAASGGQNLDRYTETPLSNRLDRYL